MAQVDFILFGNMCSGKTTVGIILEETLGYTVVAAKNVVRDNLDSASEKVKALREKGYLLPDDLIIQWVFQAIEDQGGSGVPVILDGFPRTAAQAEAVLEYYPGPTKVVFLDFPMPIIERRFEGRVLCEGCEMPYSKHFEDFADECVFCGSRAFSPRPTDRPDYLKIKTEQFAAVSMQVLPVLRGANMPLLSVGDHTRFASLRAEVESLAPHANPDERKDETGGD